MAHKRLLSVLAVGACLIASPASGQAPAMSDLLDRLFVFGDGDQPLFLVGSAGVSDTEVHGDHFIPAETEANALLLGFFKNAIARNVSSFPVPTTVSSRTVEFVDGVPTPTSSSFGPIAAERAQTVGRGRLNAGVSFTRLRFARLRGTDLDDVRFRFVHQNVDFPDCDQIFDGDCSLHGVPGWENDVIDLRLSLDLAADVFAFYATYGVSDRVDVSVAIPVVDFRMRGRSLASVVPTTEDQANHFFGGTPTDPDLTADRTVAGGTSGIGDVAVRLKARLASSDVWQVGVLGETRAATGDEDNFLGTGAWSARALLILSGNLGEFSPHTNLGFEYRGGDLDRHQFETVVGFDHLMADWVTLAVDLLGSFELGQPTFTPPEPVEMEAPFERSVELTNIVDRNDDVLDGSIGLKFRTRSDLVVLVNALVPLNEGGLRSSPIPTIAVEYSL